MPETYELESIAKGTLAISDTYELGKAPTVDETYNSDVIVKNSTPRNEFIDLRTIGYVSSKRLSISPEANRLVGNMVRSLAPRIMLE